MRTTLLFFTIILLNTAVIAQSFWDIQAQNQNLLKEACEDCPVYNYADIEANVDWQYTLGGESGSSIAIDIDYAPDSNFIVLWGNMGSFFAKYDVNGEQLWNKELLISEDTIFIASEFIRKDNNYYIAGMWYKDITEKTYGIMKTDINGNKLWHKKLYSDPNNKNKANEYTNPEIINIEAKNILVSLSIWSDDMYIIKLDSAGNVLWEISNHELNFERTTNPLMLLFVESQYILVSNYKYWKVNLEGEVIINDTLKGRHKNLIYYNNEIYANGSDSEKQWVRKYNTDFEIINEYENIGQEYRNIGWAADFKVLNDESILVFYDKEYMLCDDCLPEYDISILHLDKNMNCISISDFHAAKSQYSNELLIDKNNDLIIYGYGYNDYFDRDMLMLMKLNRLPISIENMERKTKLNVFPNPVLDELSIMFENQVSGKLEMYDYKGRKVYSININGQNTIKLNMEPYTFGLYMLTFIAKQKRYVQKILKK